MTTEISTDAELISRLAAEAEQALQGVTDGRAVQFHPHYCKEADGAPFSDWDSSHDVSVIRPDGSRYRIASFRHASDAAFDQFARAWVREAAAALTALSEQNTALAAQVAELTTELDELRSKFKNVVSHATMGQTCDADLSLNQISVMITRIRNDWYADKQAAETKVAELTADLNGVVSECRRMREEYNAASDQLAAAEAEVARLEGAGQADADLLFYAYKGMLVLQRLLTKTGLTAGIEAAGQIIARIETAHPEMPARSSLRATPTEGNDKT
jgi:hypothetical protein